MNEPRFDFTKFWLKYLRQSAREYRDWAGHYERTGFHQGVPSMLRQASDYDRRADEISAQH